MADSPLGPLVLVADGDGRLCGLLFADRLPAALALGPADPGPFREVRTQLDAYFAGVRRGFDLPLAAAGTPFQRSVWAALAGLAYGTTVSYGALAVTLGRPGAGRAVGLANGANPISIILPCHRVIGADGALTGYGGGVERKRFLLELEGVGAAQLRLLDGPGYRRSYGAGSPTPTAVGPAPTGTVLRSAWSASPDGTADASGGVR